MIKGDQSCIAVAATSVLAKVRRDTLMAELEAGAGEGSTCRTPSAPTRATLTGPPGGPRGAGPHPHHRLSWSYLDALPRWRHLKKVRLSVEAAALESGGQLGFDF